MTQRYERQTELTGAVAEGVELCRRGQWKRGVEILRQVAADEERTGELPGLFYSYLGFGVARFDHRLREGVALCRHAVKHEFYQPENYLNLARTYMLADDRKHAVRAIHEGLKIDPEHQGLRTLRSDLGVRRRPVLPFLSRDHALNRLFGRLRHSMSSGGRPRGT